MKDIHAGSCGRNSSRPVQPTMLINEISKVFHDRLRKANEEAGVPSGFRSLLFHLSRCDGRTQLELAKATHLKPPTVSIALQKMEASGYVTRRHDTNDNRATFVYLTEKGAKIDRDNLCHILKFEEQVMNGISDDEKETLLRILTKMRDNVISDSEKPDGCQ